MEDPRQYLYGYRGPWPRPSPVALDDAMSATAVLLPDQEIEKFRATIVKRYGRQVRYGWLKPLLDSLFFRGLEPLSDEELIHLIVETPYSRFLNPVLDEVDEQAFAEILSENRDADEIFKVDFSGLSLVEPLPELYFATTVTLVRRDADGRHSLLATAIDGVLLRPGCGPAWELAKYFVLQGCAIHLIECFHPRVHFPFNAANALTKTLLRKDHILLRLLLPHLEIQLPLDYGAMYHEKAVIRNNQDEIYTPFVDRDNTVFRLISAGYQGIEGNSSYPAFRFELGPGTIHSEYGTYLDQYYQTTLRFVEQVLVGVPDQDPDVKRWAKVCSQYVPGFPDDEQIFEPGLLARTVATMICNYSVAHTADHHGYANHPGKALPLRLRVPPPESEDMEDFDYGDLLTKRDFFRYRMAHQMFFKPTILYHLGDVDYQFQAPELRELNKKFCDELRQTDRDMPVKRFATLDELATSIQF